MNLRLNLVHVTNIKTGHHHIKTMLYIILLALNYRIILKPDGLERCIGYHITMVTHLKSLCGNNNFLLS